MPARAKPRARPRASTTEDSGAPPKSSAGDWGTFFAADQEQMRKLRTSTPGLLQKTDEVSVRDSFNVRRLISARGQHGRKPRQIGNGVQVSRGLFAPKRS